MSNDANDRPDTLRNDIMDALNRRSAENGSNTPDFILAEYLLECLETFDKFVKRREMWYSIESCPGMGTRNIKTGTRI